ncbi:hypothetical protein EDD18DRAFT_790393 [Armillaria luteobubalina]|uniref:Uncharacterized protein n=1 Tax=Armillaria luteobubalina TaxID=153913 RepID=A0AA39QE06_9AGAR|nr:hypothetical protein EDD18DRAFT_790393 [Armillaria luteobubalina]
MAGTSKKHTQHEALIGSDGLPRFEDREHFPYVNALSLGVSRMAHCRTTGLPHCVIEDDVQSGYFIPNGSLVYANIWYV